MEERKLSPKAEYFLHIDQMLLNQLAELNSLRKPSLFAKIFKTKSYRSFIKENQELIKRFKENGDAYFAFMEEQSDEPRTGQR